MLHFDELSKASSIFTDKNVTKLIIPIAVDTMADCKLFKGIAEKYPEITNKFTIATQGKTFKPGDYIRIQTDCGHSIFFIVIRMIEKFQPYLCDTWKALDKVIEAIKRETDPNSPSPGSVLFPLPTCDELKLSDSIVFPAISDKLNIKGLEVFVLTNGDHDQYVERVTDTAVYYKMDSWKSDWMLTLDDILVIDIIAQLTILLHEFKISKTNLVKCYFHCHANGMFPKLEFYETEYGPFFKMFLLKTNALINHGLLMNTSHYSTQEPKKFGCILGPMWPILRHIAYTIIMENREKTKKIVNEIKQDYFDSFKKQDGQQKPAYQKPDSNFHKPNADINMFNL